MFLNCFAKTVLVNVHGVPHTTPPLKKRPKNAKHPQSIPEPPLHAPHETQEQVWELFVGLSEKKISLSLFLHWSVHTSLLITLMSEEEKREVPTPEESKVEETSVKTNKKTKRNFEFTEKRKEAFEKCRQRRQEALERKKQLAEEGKVKKMTERAEFKRAWMLERKRKNHPPAEELEAMLHEEHKEEGPPTLSPEPSPAPRTGPAPVPMEQDSSRDDLIRELHMMVGELFDQQQELKNIAREKEKEPSKRGRQQETVYSPPSDNDMFIFV